MMGGEGGGVASWDKWKGLEPGKVSGPAVNPPRPKPGKMRMERKETEEEKRKQEEFSS